MTDNTTEVEELREKIIEKIGLEKNTLTGQLLPKDIEDMMSDWQFTITDIMALFADTMLELIGEDEPLPKNPLGLPKVIYEKSDARNQLRAQLRAKIEEIKQ